MPDNVKCTVTTNKQWEEKCKIDKEKQTIYITDVFSESTTFSTKVTILLEGVVNPKNNKEKGSGFLLTTYTSEKLIYRIDQIPSQKLVPTLQCQYPCKTCLESDKTNCLSCWI